MTLFDLVLYENKICCKIELLGSEIKTLAENVSHKPIVIYRVKHPETLLKKKRLKVADDVFLIHDIYGIRVIVRTTEEAYAVLGEVKKLYPGFIDHDYIQKPKVRADKPELEGKSLRMLQYIGYRNDVPFEIQITTTEFNEINESFHEQYHNEKYR